MSMPKLHPVEHQAWRNMRSRCLHKSYRSWHRYGGRGISICDRWLNSFENFLADMGKRPSSEHSLDRFPNNDGNYEPGNCRWATDEQQRANKSHGAVDIAGQRFGRLTVIRQVHDGFAGANTQARWLCKCECGEAVISFGQNLRLGKSRSCGCSRRRRNEIAA